MTVQGNASKLSTRIGFFNDQIRDGIKGGVFDGAEAQGFVNGNMISAKEVSPGIRANTTGGGKRWTAMSPEQCVTYASCHDNMTLYDKLVAANYGANSDYRARYSNAITQNMLTSAIISSSQGIDFILAGEEMGRSKDGDENSYKSPATLNMIDWSLLETNADLVSYYKGMFELRKAFSPFTANLTDAQDDSYEYIFDTSVTSSLSTIAYTIHNNTEGEWNKVAVIYNGKTSPVNFKFNSKTKKDKTIDENTEWVIVANDKTAGVTKLGEVKGITFSVPASSALIAVEKSTFEECAITSEFSKVYTEHVYEKTGEVLNTGVVLGRPGEGYSLTADDSIPLEYALDHVDGDLQGTFGDDDSVVTFYYSDYVPTPFTAPTGDIDDSGDVDIVDATVLQRYLVNLKTLDEEHIKRGDYNVDGDTDMVDVTVLQRYLAHMIKPVFNVTSRHMEKKEDGSTKALTTAETTRVRYGEPYSTTAKKIAYYSLIEEPANATGVVTGDVVVDYYYQDSVASPKMHVKHSGEVADGGEAQTWDPNLWAWAYDGPTPVNCYSDWPGLQLTDPDENGWYNVTFPIPGGLDYYFIISKNGNPQTADYGPISYDEYPEIWVVIDDVNVGKADGKWVSYYNYNPDIEN